ncbi:hypothetical protein [Sporomusa carbonis]|uniref:hypothetical protein n=1 Tax=Sporomusa carbonis TaxID=3076075 RepID=UPI003C7EC8C3
MENKETNFQITILREFTQADFGDLSKVVQGILPAGKIYLTFDFTSGNFLHSKGVPGFPKIMESVISAGSMLRIVCYAKDYTMFFRNVSGLKIGS